MQRNLTIEEVYEILAKATLLENLGFFVGAGFSKAILENQTKYKAYSWYELLETCCDKLNVDSSVLKGVGSYSDMASEICKKYALKHKIDYVQAVIEFKKMIALLTNSYPTEEAIEKFQTCFMEMTPAWIVTTNYDMLLENVFIGRALPLGPHEAYMKVKDMIPIYHIHGMRTTPQDIVITREDYVSLFRPNDYRQARLPFLIKESTVLMIGYGVGDINVISALDWCSNVYTNVIEDYNTEIIQLLYTKHPNSTPYRDDNGIIIVEIKNLADFFLAFNHFYPVYEKKYSQKQEMIEALMKVFIAPTKIDIVGFIEDRTMRKELIRYVSDLNLEFTYIYPSYISFLKAVMLELGTRAEPNGAFSAYDEKLKVLIDVFESIDLKRVPPTLFWLMADAFDRVAYYIGNESGQSWAALKTWEKEKEKLSSEIVKELIDYAETKKNYCYLKRLFSYRTIE